MERGQGDERDEAEMAGKRKARSLHLRYIHSMLLCIHLSFTSSMLLTLACESRNAGRGFSRGCLRPFSASLSWYTSNARVCEERVSKEDEAMWGNDPPILVPAPPVLGLLTSPPSPLLSFTIDDEDVRGDRDWHGQA